jgi:hypothetical protein
MLWTIVFALVALWTFGLLGNISVWVVNVLLVLALLILTYYNLLMRRRSKT